MITVLSSTDELILFKNLFIIIIFMQSITPFLTSQNYTHNLKPAAVDQIWKESL